MLEICKQLGIELREQHSQGSNLYLFNGKSMTVDDLKNDPKFGQELRSFVDKIDHLSNLYNKYVLIPKLTPELDTCPNDPKTKLRSTRMLSEFDTKLVSEYL